MKKGLVVICGLCLMLLLSGCPLSTGNTLLSGESSGSSVAIDGSTIQVGQGSNTIYLRVEEDSKIKTVYSTMINTNGQSANLRQPSQEVTLAGVNSGVYYLNVMSQNGRWVVENEPPVNEEHRPLTFKLLMKINEGEWQEVTASATQKAGGKWWNLQIIVP